MPVIRFDEDTIYVLFPYLTSDKPVTIWGITLRSSDDLDGVDPIDKAELQRLFKMFYVRHGQRIERMMYYIIAAPKAEHDEKQRRAAEMQSILSALIAQRFSSFNADRCRMYFAAPVAYPASWWVNTSAVSYQWKPQTDQPSDDDSIEGAGVDGYDLIVDALRWAYVANDEPIYPLFGTPRSLDGLDLSAVLKDHILNQEENWSFQRLIDTDPEKHKPDETIQRVLRSLPWFKKTVDGTIESDQEAILYLATAFEALLDTDFSGVTIDDDDTKAKKGYEPTRPHFLRALHLLVGHLPRLAQWGEQFYRARNDIVHRGEAPQLHFVTTKKRKGQTDEQKRNEAIKVARLSEFGKKVFQLCFRAVLSGYYCATDTGLSDELVHNQERLQLLLDKLGRGESFAGIRSLVDHLALRSGPLHSEMQRVPFALVLQVTKAVIAEYTKKQINVGARAQKFFDQITALPDNAKQSAIAGLVKELLWGKFPDRSIKKDRWRIEYEVGGMFFGYLWRVAAFGSY